MRAFVLVLRMIGFVCLFVCSLGEGKWKEYRRGEEGRGGRTSVDTNACARRVKNDSRPC